MFLAKHWHESFWTHLQKNHTAIKIQAVLTDALYGNAHFISQMALIRLAYTLININNTRI
jgi:hypothetical protein